MENYEYHFLPLQLDTAFGDNKAEEKYFKQPNASFEPKEMRFNGKNNCNDFVTMAPLVKVHEQWFHGIRMYSPFEFVYYRFRNDDNTISIEWFGCLLPLEKSFEVAIAECLKNIISSGCTKKEAIEWVKNLGSLMNWINHSEKIVRELLLYENVSHSIYDLIKNAHSDVLSVQSRFKKMISEYQVGTNYLLNNIPKDIVNIETLLLDLNSFSCFEVVNNSATEKINSVNYDFKILNQIQNHVPLFEDLDTRPLEHEKLFSELRHESKKIQSNSYQCISPESQDHVEYYKFYNSKLKLEDANEAKLLLKNEWLNQYFKFRQQNEMNNLMSSFKVEKCQKSVPRPRKLKSNEAQYEFVGGPNTAELCEIIKKYIESPGQVKKLVHHFENIPNEGSTLFIIFKSISSGARIALDDKIKMLEDLKDARLFTFYKDKRNIIVKKSERYYLDENPVGDMNNLLNKFTPPNTNTIAESQTEQNQLINTNEVTPVRELNDNLISYTLEESTLSFFRESPPSITSASVSNSGRSSLNILLQTRSPKPEAINRNQAKTLEIISRHVNSANLCRLISNKLEAMPLLDSMTLNDLASCLSSRSRPRREIFIAILNELHASNLFVYDNDGRKRSSIVFRKGPRYWDN